MLYENITNHCFNKMIDLPLSNTIVYSLYIYVILLSLITFILFGIDKYRAIKYTRENGNRISEKTLFIWSFLGGTVGAVLAMIVFRHKIKKGEFLIKFFIVTLVQFEIIYFIVKG